MASFLVEFGDWLEEETGLDLGTTLFLGQRPDSAPALCTVVLNRVPGRVHPDVSRQRQIRYQFVTRGATYIAGDTEARRVFEKIINLRSIRLSGWTIQTSMGNEPAFVQSDEQGRSEFSSNVTFMVRKET